ncbi:MAG: hypothetical protein ACRCUH_03745 [Shewanella sp.]
MKLAALSLLISISVMASESPVKLPEYQFKESKLANYTPQNGYVNSSISALKNEKKPIEQFDSLHTPVSADSPLSAANALAALSILAGGGANVEYQTKYLVKNNDQYMLIIQPMLGSPSNMLIEHYLQLDTNYKVTEENGSKVHRFSFADSRMVDTRPWNQKLAMYVTPELSAQIVDHFFANTSVFYKTTVANNDCKQLQSDISKTIPNFGYGDGMVERKIGLTDKSALMFKIKIDKKNRVDFTIDPLAQDGKCLVYIRSYATTAQDNKFDFDEQILKTVALINQLVSKQNIDLSAIEVVLPPQRPTDKRTN